MGDRRSSVGRRTADSARLHWMKFYLDDWATSLKVRMMGPIARAWYWELLMLQWREGYVSDSDQSLMRYLLQMPRDPSHLQQPIADDSNDYPAILRQVKECFRELNQGKLVNDKLHLIRNQTLAEFKAKSVGAQRANAKRWLTESVSSPDSDSDTDIDTEKNNTYKRSKFIPPALGEIQAYCEERKNGVDAQKWFNYYTANGWKVGRNSMRDWRAAVRTWERNGASNGRQSAFERVADEVGETD